MEDRMVRDSSLAALMKASAPLAEYESRPLRTHTCEKERESARKDAIAAPWNASDATVRKNVGYS